MGCNCGRGSPVEVTARSLGYKVVGLDGSCALSVQDVCRVFGSAGAAARAAATAGLSNWTVVPVRGT